MPKRLTAAFVRTVARPGVYGDEHGLRLRVTATGSRQWIWRGTIRGRRRDLGLGAPPYVGLAEARDIAFTYRKLAREGGDPAALRQRLDVPTFAEAVEKVLAIQREGWKDGSRHEAIWRRSLDHYAMPRLGQLRVDEITTADVMGVLLPEWQAKHETLRRVRQRIGTVMRWAVAQGFRQDNPAGEAIGAALPKPGRVVQHMRALPHGEVAAAVAVIRNCRAWWATKAALEFTAHTACRSGEVRFARWDEVDLESAIWVVPASRTKTKREHRVPLTARALAILAEARTLADGNGLVFPSKTGRVLSDSTLSKLLRENGIAGTPHGLRSSFRDWCGETGQPREVAEASLAHAVGNRVEAAYARSDLLARRRALMDAWCRYLTGDVAAVVALHRHA